MRRKKLFEDSNQRKEETERKENDVNKEKQKESFLQINHSENSCIDNKIKKCTKFSDSPSSIEYNMYCSCSSEEECDSTSKFPAQYSRYSHISFDEYNKALQNKIKSKNTGTFWKTYSTIELSDYKKKTQSENQKREDLGNKEKERKLKVRTKKEETYRKESVLSSECQNSGESEKRKSHFNKETTHVEETENSIKSTNEKKNIQNGEIKKHLLKIIKKTNQKKKGTLLSKIKNKDSYDLLYSNLKETEENNCESETTKELLFKLYLISLEHKKTNFLCLEEILKKLNVLLQKQVEINKATASQRSERQKLFQHVYELKEQIADRAFHSMINKDFAKSSIKGNTQKDIKNEDCEHNEQIESTDIKKRKQKKKKKKNDLTNHSLNYVESFQINNNHIDRFMTHLNTLENSVYTFTHFCRNMASQTYPDGKKGLNPLEQKIYLFLQNPESMRLIRSIEKKLTQIKSICTDY